MTGVRYAQCWEDTDILLEALDVGPGQVCLSIASAGDNTLALLTRQPARVIAVDMNPAQIACLELRVCAYRTLFHPELLELIGSTPSTRRLELYRRCRDGLSTEARQFWDARETAIARGIGTAGRFERYLEIFRHHVLPLVHTREAVDALLQGGMPAQREAFYSRTWDTRRWRLLYRLFFSRFVMAKLGRDPSCFTYVNGAVSERLLARTRYALTALDPADNPYLEWICTGRHRHKLPYALRAENFQAIRANLDRLEWHCCTLEDQLGRTPADSIDRYNLSDVFEYMSAEHYQRTLSELVRAGRRNGRLVYWNMLADRHRPERMGAQLQPLTELSGSLHRRDLAFFYSDLVIEEIT